MSAGVQFPLAVPETEEFYANCLHCLQASGIPFLLAGTHAVRAYTGLARPTKDLDIFCKPGDYPRILGYFRERGYETEIEDERWLAKIRRGPDFLDVIFNSATAVMPVNDHWFAEVYELAVYGTPVRIVAPTELVWSKVFVQDRTRYDGADIAHVFLKQHDRIDWRRLLSHMDQYWEVLLIHLLNFGFIYPSERCCIPQWILDELIDRLRLQAALPTAQTKICRGRMFSRTDYLIDVRAWGFADVVGEGDRKLILRDRTS